MKLLHPFKEGNIAYETFGKGSAVVLLHGFLANTAFWKDIATELSKSYRLFLIDLPGHGQSSTYGYHHSMELMAEGVLSVLKAHRIRKVHLIGHSLGGYVALAFAEYNPDMLKSLLLINATAKGDSKERKKSREQLKRLFHQSKSQTLKHFIPTFFTLQNEERPQHIARYSVMANECTLKGIAANIEGMKHRKEREIILRFAPYPFAYLIGEKDNILNKDTLIEEAQLGTMGSMGLIEDGGHMLPMEATQKTTEAIKSFLKKLKL